MYIESENFTVEISKWHEIRDYYLDMINDPRIKNFIGKDKLYKWRHKLSIMFVWYGTYIKATRGKRSYAKLLEKRSLAIQDLLKFEKINNIKSCPKILKLKNKGV